MPRLSTIHPYPAMMPDDLVTSLVHKYGGSILLDPFCGTGRVCLAAAEAGALAFGMDVNPLALLISRAKAHSDHTDSLLEVLQELLATPRSLRPSHIPPLDPRAGRKVKWLGQNATRELREIVNAIDLQRRSPPTQLLLAAVLSATVREVSFARRDQWKLHRLPATARATVRQAAWRVFERRLRSVWRELLTLNPLPGSCTFALSDARYASIIVPRLHGSKFVDAIITSPPYGDSQSTVQYGGMSSLCLDVVSRIREFQPYATSCPAIDRAALGGRTYLDAADAAQTLSGYWAGSSRNPRCRSAGSYLRDLQASLQASAACLRPRGTFVTVVARRLIGGWRLRTDEFVDHTLRAMGFVCVERTRRRIAAKVTPPTVAPHARSTGPPRRATARTMREEWILVHRAPGHAVSK